MDTLAEGQLTTGDMAYLVRTAHGIASAICCSEGGWLGQLGGSQSPQGLTEHIHRRA